MSDHAGRRRVIVTGNAVADVVAWPVDEVPQSSGIHPESVTLLAGGCAGNSAMIAARLGTPVSLLTTVGEDPLGHALRVSYEEKGVDVSLVQPITGASTGISIVLVHSNGARRFISNPGANRLLRPSMIPPSALASAFALHIGGFFAVAGLEDGTLPGKLAEAQSLGVLTSLNPIGGPARRKREVLYPLLPHLDLLILNEDEGEKVTDQGDVAGMMSFLLDKGVGSVIITRGEQGCQVAGKYGNHSVPAFPATPVDRTGAGDAFAGGLLASLARGDAFEQALRWANAAGAATIEAVGATGQWHGWEDLESVAARLPVSR